MTTKTYPTDRRQVGDADQARALALAVRHVNASTRVPITEAALRTVVVTGDIPHEFEHHVSAFIDETDRATLCDLVLSRATTYGKLASLADRLLPPEHTNRRWLHDRREL